MKVIGVKINESAFFDRTHPQPGWGMAMLSDGTFLHVSDTIAGMKGLNGVCDFAESKGYDATEMRQRLDVWVKTGKLPPAQG